MIPETEFADHVRDALANLYDPVHLQQHPLVGLMQLQPAVGVTVGEALRKLLREAVEALRPPPSIPADSSAWEHYRVLQLHYLRCLDQMETCQTLGISVATFYRRHRPALQAVASVLWERYQHLSTSDSDLAALPAKHLPANGGPTGLAALPRIPSRPVDIEVLVDGIQETILPLAEQRGVEVRMKVSAALPVLYVDASILRQIVLSALSIWITRTTSRVVELAVNSTDDEMLWQVRGVISPSGPEDAIESDSRYLLSQDLLLPYGGSMGILREAESVSTLTFRLPVEMPKSILIVDDDPRTVDLYRSYLQSSSYVILQASSVAQAEAVLSESRADLVLLDVIMPHQDGWVALQHLREMPQIADIPIVVCSVLYQPELAISLGATRLLTKPITQEQLLETVHECLAREGSSAQGHQA